MTFARLHPTSLWPPSSPRQQEVTCSTPGWLHLRRACTAAGSGVVVDVRAGNEQVGAAPVMSRRREDGSYVGGAVYECSGQRGVAGVDVDAALHEEAE